MQEIDGEVEIVGQDFKNPSASAEAIMFSFQVIAHLYGYMVSQSKWILDYDCKPRK